MMSFTVEDVENGIGVTLIQVEMVLAGGKAERFPVGGQHHHALAPA